MMKKDLLCGFLVGGFIFASSMHAESLSEYTNVLREEIKPMEAKVFDDGLFTFVNGNSLYLWLGDGYQRVPSPEFEKTRIIEFRGSDASGQKVFRDLGTLKSIRKYQNKESLERFEKHAKANNGTICSSCIQVKNRDGEFKPVAVLVMGSQKDHCADAQEWIHEQEKDSQDQ